MADKGDLVVELYDRDILSANDKCVHFYLLLIGHMVFFLFTNQVFTLKNKSFERRFHLKKKKRSNINVWNYTNTQMRCSLGSFTVNLADWLKKCYIEQRPVKPFEEINNAMAGKKTEVSQPFQDAG